MSFSSLKLSSQINKALVKHNFKEPTPIQEKVIPLVLDGRDVMAKAKTGSGKSASYILPILELLQKRRGEGKAKIKVLVLTPTRELTLQVAQAFENFGEFMQTKPKVVSVIGGEGIGDQLYAIQQGCDILVATSGRFLDVLSKKQMNLSHLEFLVLDEADKMLNLGFAEELDLVLEAIPEKRQNLLFSATYPEKILNIASRITQDSVEVSIDEDVPTVDTIIQRVIEVNRDNRGPLLRHLIKSEKLKHILVFMANKRATDNIAEKFRKYGFTAESFHGDLHQEDRTYTLNEFRDKKINILFATDIAARGLDIENIECVINFDLPRSPTDYIHRIGRTARAGKSGLAISFISFEDQAHFSVIEKKCKVKIEKEQIEGFELIGEAPKVEKGPAPVKGKGKSKKDKAREKALRESK
ncbi:DEAD/DEAH box helicase domain protein [Sulfurimonas gotlandica GD1]|uniref:DEAD/DEAH box helicase domain protein n=1 Tax=Sulfurimonas gotlandica (strain DSM 19862 / JCM 16533 / GD1) TaxID=929558 RepID=B6BNY6_SULGG|nr:DEAD/DEAH box helicase [Sulfurimonas gotlandica]EDZ61277.1 ATP-dependent RNA helicase RhlE [Sulfurimonas gotlandica GD1]EHP28942.1 DEAD/DEAH box helicase domain protein [Sulfurimonas gotlandica GD1]